MAVKSLHCLWLVPLFTTDAKRPHTPKPYHFISIVMHTFYTLTHHREEPSWSLNAWRYNCSHLAVENTRYWLDCVYWHHNNTSLALMATKMRCLWKYCAAHHVQWNPTHSGGIWHTSILLSFTIFLPWIHWHIHFFIHSFPPFFHSFIRFHPSFPPFAPSSMHPSVKLFLPSMRQHSFNSHTRTAFRSHMQHQARHTYLEITALRANWAWKRAVSIEHETWFCDDYFSTSVQLMVILFSWGFPPPFFFYMMRLPTVQL